MKKGLAQTEYGFGSVGNRTCIKTIATGAMGNADTILSGNPIRI